ncbi:hypothetical protein BH23BAC4_BH23BAC4_14170 [soil metagenome]
MSDSSATRLAELEQQLKRESSVADLARRALAGTEPLPLVVAATEAVARVLDVPFSGGFERRGWEGDLVLRAGFGWPDNATASLALPATHQHVTRPMDVEGAVAVYEPVPEELESLGIKCGISAAVARSGGGPSGLIAAYTTEARSFTVDERAFLEAIAGVLAGALDRAHGIRALSESEARARAVLETTVDGVITIDARGYIATFNSAAERIFGYTAEEVIGSKVEVLMPEPYHSEHDGYLRSYHETGRRQIIGIGREVTGRRKDGSTFPMDLAVSEVVLEGRVLFTGVIRDISERRHLERELLRIQNDERVRIGQDLHDGLGQMLTGTGLIARGLARKLRAAGDEAADDIDEIAQLIHEADQHARSLARGLVPVDLEQDGLPAALARLCRQAEQLFGISCNLEIIGPAESVARSLPEPTHLYRIAQESISNAVRHGRASRVDVALAAGVERIRLRVEDDGVGIGAVVVAGGPDLPAPVQPEDNRGMGVRIMHFRARILGGALEMRPGVDGGTVVTCTVPIRHTADAA